MEIFNEVINTVHRILYLLSRLSKQISKAEYFYEDFHETRVVHIHIYNNQLIFLEYIHFICTRKIQKLFATQKMYSVGIRNILRSTQYTHSIELCCLAFYLYVSFGINTPNS